MDRKKKIILISALIILIIVALFLLFYFIRKKPAETELPLTNQNQNQTPTTGKIDSLPPPSPEIVKNEKDYPLGLQSLTSSYAERFASYSSDANFKNLQDLKVLSTSKMQSFIDNFITNSNLGSSGYEAQEAKALNNQLIYLNQDKAMVLISLQLSKIQGAQINPVISYSKIELSAIKSGDDWKVDEANWK